MDIRALVVDDSAIMRKMVMRALRESRLANFSFTEAEDGAVALEKFDPNQIDMLFVDWNMPNMNGIELIEKIRSTEAKRTPIVMVTTESTMGKVEQAMDEAGVDQYIAKPFTTDDLQNRLGPLFAQIAQSKKKKKGFFGRLVEAVS
jgi:two-component system chemotaxis response regulator CheY